jgi:hypothetical protein
MSLSSCVSSVDLGMVCGQMEGEVDLRAVLVVIKLGCLGTLICLSRTSLVFSRSFPFSCSFSDLHPSFPTNLFSMESHLLSPTSPSLNALPHLLLRRFVASLLMGLLTTRTTITEWATSPHRTEWISIATTPPTTSTISLPTLPE